MKILHLLSAGETGGIEVLVSNYAEYSRLHNVFVFIWRGGLYAEKLRAQGNTVICLDGDKCSPITTLRKLIETIGKEKPDVVVDHHGAPLTRYAESIAKMWYHNFALISYIHSNAGDQFWKEKTIKAFLVNRSNVLALKKTDFVIAVSASVKDSVTKSFSYPEDKMAVLYNGVPLQKYQAANADNGHTSEHINLVYVGRLTKIKGVQTIIEAMNLLPANISLTVVGDGPYRDTLEQLASKCGNRVTFLGSRSDVPEILAKSDIFVHMPECEEGFGITVVEAMAAGKVCVVADSGALPEIVTDSVNGFLVEKGNIQALARKIQEIAGKLASEEMQQIRANAVKRAEDFSIQRYSEALDALIESTAGKSVSEQQY